MNFSWPRNNWNLKDSISKIQISMKSTETWKKIWTLTTGKTLEDLDRGKRMNKSILISFRKEWMRQKRKGRRKGHFGPLDIYSNLPTHTTHSTRKIQDPLSISSGSLVLTKVKWSGIKLGWMTLTLTETIMRLLSLDLWMWTGQWIEDAYINYCCPR